MLWDLYLGIFIDTEVVAEDDILEIKTAVLEQRYAEWDVGRKFERDGTLLNLSENGAITIDGTTYVVTEVCSDKNQE